MNWKSIIREAEIHIKSRNYLGAKEKYQDALAHAHSPIDRALLLSNLVVCRIKLGGDENLNLALNEANECISLREGWSKGYVRLASVYLALGGHSNDACQALQSAIRLDSSNTMARRMLINNLRRDQVQANNNDDSVIDDDIDFITGDADNESILSWFISSAQRGLEWYRTSDENVKMTVKVVAVVIMLYIAFGGRFGLDSLFGTATNTNRSLGNYGQGNAYDRYYNQMSIKHNTASSRLESKREQYYNFNFNSRRDIYDRNSVRYHQSGHSLLYILSTMGLLYALHALGVPVNQTPFRFGMRRLHFGRINIGVRGDGMNFGFRQRRWF